MQNCIHMFFTTTYIGKVNEEKKGKLVFNMTQVNIFENLYLKSCISLCLYIWVYHSTSEIPELLQQKIKDNRPI